MKRGLSTRPTTSSLKKIFAKESRQKEGRLIKRGRPTGSKRLRKDMIYIGTWNVMTLLKTRKMNEIADEMSKTQLQLIAVQELRWKRAGQINL